MPVCVLHLSVCASSAGPPEDPCITCNRYFYPGDLPGQTGNFLYPYARGRDCVYASGKCMERKTAEKAGISYQDESHPSCKEGFSGNRLYRAPSCAAGSTGLAEITVQEVLGVLTKDKGSATPLEIRKDETGLVTLDAEIARSHVDTNETGKLPFTRTQGSGILDNKMALHRERVPQYVVTNLDGSILTLQSGLKQRYLIKDFLTGKAEYSTIQTAPAVLNEDPAQIPAKSYIQASAAGGVRTNETDEELTETIVQSPVGVIVNKEVGDGRNLELECIEEWVHHREASEPRLQLGENKFETNAGTGAHGGTCTCPDGQQYQVGDEMNGCGSLACIGGTSGACNRAAGAWSNNKATCVQFDLQGCKTACVAKMFETNYRNNVCTFESVTGQCYLGKKSQSVSERSFQQFGQVSLNIGNFTHTELFAYR